MEKGQINVEFLAGSLLFLIALTFVVTNAFAQIPTFVDDATINRISSRANTISQVLVTESGFWRNETASGTDWEGNGNTEDARRIGLAIEPYVLNESKVAALNESNDPDTINYSEADILLEARNLTFRITNVTEYVIVDTFDSYNKSEGTPDKIVPPNASDYSDDYDIVHHGFKRINGKNVYALVTSNETDDISYTTVWITKQNWNFSNVTGDDTAQQSHTYAINGQNYTLRREASGTRTSNGKTLLFTRRLLSNFGPQQPLGERQVIVVREYATVNGNLAKFRMEAWEE